jgi:hypothetical protein
LKKRMKQAVFCKHAGVHARRRRCTPCTTHAPRTAHRRCTKTVGALPPGDAFPAPHKPECAKLRKNNDRFAYLPGSNPNRFADLPTDDDASIAWRPKRFAPMQRHAIDRIRIACPEGAKTTGRARLFQRMRSNGRAMNAIPLVHCIRGGRLPAQPAGHLVAVGGYPTACSHADIPHACPRARHAPAAAQAGGTNRVSFRGTGRADATTTMPRPRHAKGKSRAKGSTRAQRPARAAPGSESVS